MALSHRSNPRASLRIEQLYGVPVQLEIAKVLVVVICDLKAEVRHCIKNNKKLLAFILPKYVLIKQQLIKLFFSEAFLLK